MIRTHRLRGRTCLGVAFCSAWLGGVAAASGQVAAVRPAERGPVPTLAVLDFVADDPAHPTLGAEVAEALAVMLSAEPGFTLVERASILKALDEQALGRSGMVEPGQAAQIGQLVGAKLLLTGKVFTLGNKTFVVAKLVGTETSLVEGVLVQAPAGADLGDLVGRLFGKVVSKLREVGPDLVAAPARAADRLPALRALLAARQRPMLSLSIAERHFGAHPAARIDPAAETEMRRLLLGAGFQVVDVASAGLRIDGEAFSELGTRVGNLVSCGARVELSLVEVRTGRVVFSDRVTARGVDLGEQIAGKAALEEAGRQAALRLLEHFAASLPKAGGAAR
jgi:TolB-like protein